MALPFIAYGWYMVFEQLWNELKSSVPKIDSLFAQKLVNRGWRDIRDSRRWSFLCSETVLTSPDQISDGTASVTQGSQTVVLDAGAQAALVGFTNNQLIERTFRAGPSSHLYNIIGYVAPNLTLAYGYSGPTAAGITYFIYQPYYLAPSDFLSWTSVIDPFAPMPTFNLTTSKEELDSIDPQRGCLGQPHVLASYKYETLVTGSNPPITDRHRYEMWPHPITFRQYPALYQKKGIDLVAGQSQPSIIPDALIMARVKYRAYEWAMANKGKHPELKGVDWMTLRVASEKEYERELAKASRQDEEIFQQNFLRSYMQTTVGTGLGGTFWQNHAPIWGGGGYF